MIRELVEYYLAQLRADNKHALTYDELIELLLLTRDLDDTAEHLEQENRRLIEENEELIEEITCLRYKNDDLDDTADHLEQENRRLSKEITCVLYENEHLEQENRRLSEIKREHRVDSNPILLWWRDNVEFGANYGTPKTEVWDDHRRWRHTHGHQSTFENVFAKELRRILIDHGIETPDSRRRNGKERTMMWNGIRLLR